ncbi:calcium-binding protein, partial [Phytobacter sp. V91]|uniref:calcium-binding protein n=1 Tax=Phytobacter sp. V91 TaxID=3369425 RepID=UPI003F626A98
FGEGIRPEDIRLTRTNGFWKSLVLSVDGTDDSVTLKDFFYANKNQVEQIAFADGTVWDVETVRNWLLQGTDDAQKLWAYAEGSEIHAGGGNDTLYGAAGKDVLYGDEGDDTLDGDKGNDLLDGGEGNDTLYGGSGNDSLHGGTGNDTPEGGTGSDTYLFNAGGGQDTFYENSTNSGDVDVLRFGEGIRPEDIRLTRTNGFWKSLVLSVDGTDDSVTLKDFFYANKNQVEQIAFADGTVWDVETVRNWLLQGTDDAQKLWAYAEGSEIHAGGGNDTLYGAAGKDVLYGDEGNDTLDGDKGNDLLDGGEGNDTLYGGSGNDSLHGGTGNDT